MTTCKTIITTELYIRKPSMLNWERVSFSEEEFERLGEFLAELFDWEDGKVGFDTDGKQFKITEVKI